MKCSNDTVSIITIMRFFFIVDRPVQVRGQCQNNAWQKCHNFTVVINFVFYSICGDCSGKQV